VDVSRDCTNFLDTLFMLRTAEPIDFNFGMYICRMHPNKSPVKFWRKVSVGISRDWPNFSRTLNYLRK